MTDDDITYRLAADWPAYRYSIRTAEQLRELYFERLDELLAEKNDEKAPRLKRAAAKADIDALCDELDELNRRCFNYYMRRIRRLERLLRQSIGFVPE